MSLGFATFLAAVCLIVVTYIYLLIIILRWEEQEFTPPSEEDRLRLKVTKARVMEIVAWIFFALGVIMDITGFFQPSFRNSLFLIILGGCIVIASFFTATYYRKRRFKQLQQLRKMQIKREI